MRAVRSLPPFSALRAFHAAARHQHFKDAAEELGITASAISHQIRTLETHLRVQLIVRGPAGVSLTSVGREYFASVDHALSLLCNATDLVVGERSENRVLITAPPSLTTLWLIPRLGSFEAKHSDISIQFMTTVRVCDLEQEQIDLAIRYGKGPWKGVHSDVLMNEFAVPVCCPGFLGDEEDLDPATLLQRKRLILNNYHPDEWTEWAKGRSLPVPPTHKMFRLESSEQVIEAAVQGLGLAIGRSPLIQPMINKGALVMPFGDRDANVTRYFLCHSKDRQMSAAARKVSRWLKEISGTLERH